MNLKRKKRGLKDAQDSGNVRFIEDVSKARANVMGMIRAIDRETHVWSKEGAMCCYERANDDICFKFFSFPDGALSLDYSVFDRK